MNHAILRLVLYVPELPYRGVYKSLTPTGLGIRFENKEITTCLFCIRTRGQLAGVFSPSTMWVPGMRFGSGHWSPLPTEPSHRLRSENILTLLPDSQMLLAPSEGSGFLGSLRDSMVDLCGPA